MTGTTKTYGMFKDAVGKRESSNNYKIKNKWGFLGRYQFGKPRLCDFGLTTKKVVNGKVSYDWVAPFSEEVFLNSPALQDVVFDYHVALLRSSIEASCGLSIGKTFNGTLLTMSGAIACCHLLGLGGLKDFIAGKVGRDALGTSAKDYITLFAGYEIPVAKPKKPDFKSAITAAVS